MLAVCMAACASVGFAQKAGVKTNILSDVTASPNLGLEIGLAPKWTLDVSGQVNFWNIRQHRWRHWLVQPEARYWLCRSWQGHFFGLHALGGEYNVGNIDLGFDFLGLPLKRLKDHRYQGWGVGAGVSYGYAWAISRHWNLEAEIGLGWIYTRYDVYPCTHCGQKIATDRSRNYVGPTKAAINLVYLF